MDINLNIKIEVSQEIIELTTKLLSLFANAKSVTLENEPKEEVKREIIQAPKEAETKVVEEVKVEPKEEIKMPEGIDTEINLVKFTRDDLLKVITQLCGVGYSKKEIKEALNRLGFEKTANVVTEEDYIKVMNEFGRMFDAKEGK